MPLVTVSLSDKAYVIVKNVKSGERSKILSDLIEEHLSTPIIERAKMYQMIEELRKTADNCGFVADVQLRVNKPVEKPAAPTKKDDSLFDVIKASLK